MPTTADQPPVASPAAQDLSRRRRFLEGVAAVAGLAAVATVPADRAVAAVRPRSGEYPLRLGIASGDPRPYGAVLWTRLAPEPLSNDQNLWMVLGLVM